MAAITPSAISRQSAGSNTEIIATFTDIDDGDTYTSNIPSVVGFWANGTDAPGTTGNTGIDVTLTTATTGLFTFNTAEDNRTGVLHILAKIQGAHNGCKNTNKRPKRKRWFNAVQ